MTTAHKGNTSEAMVLSALVERDLAVLTPFGEGHPYDLAVHLAGTLFLRIQCKTARVVSGCVRFNTRSTDHGQGPGSYAGLADAFGVYSPQLDKVYLVPVSEVPVFSAFLRLEPPLNNQRQGVRNAEDFELARWTMDSLVDLAVQCRDSEEELRRVA